MSCNVKAYHRKPVTQISDIQRIKALVTTFPPRFLLTFKSAQRGCNATYTLRSMVQPHGYVDTRFSSC